METIAVAVIGVAGNLGGVLLSHHLSMKEQKPEPRLAMAINEKSIIKNLVSNDSAQTLSRTAVLSFIAGLANLLMPG